MVLYKVDKLLGGTNMENVEYMLESLKMINNNEYDLTKLPNYKGSSTIDINIKETVEEIFEERKFIHETKEILNNEYYLDQVIEKLLVLVGETMNTNRIGVAYVDYNRGKIIAEHGAFDYGNILLGSGFAVNIKDTSLSRIIENKKPVIYNDLEKEAENRKVSSALKLILREGIKSNLTIPLIKNDVVFGFIFFSSSKKKNYNEKDLNLAVKISQEITGILNTSYFIKKMFSTMTNAFAHLVEKRDDETGFHLVKMREYSKLIAEQLLNHQNKYYKVTPGFVKDIYDYASIHDIGKIGVPDKILKKAGPLTQSERQIMEEHTTIGAEILRGIEKDLKIFNQNYFQIPIEIAESHHERWDGKGYPQGLKGQEIPLAARIVAIADVFDALSSKRVYKESYGFDRTVEIINQAAGSQFDPELIKAFNQVLPKIKKVYLKFNNLEA